MTTNRPLRVFLCHSSNDKPAVRELYQKLHAEAWIQPRLDEEELYSGQNWNMEIEKAVEAADAIIAATALHHELVLITTNLNHFPMPELVIFQADEQGNPTPYKSA